MIDTAPQLAPLLAGPQPSPFLLGVAGGTGSGKTTVARAILEAVGRERIAFIQQDSYYRDVEWQSEAELLHHNFDHPAALDNDLMTAHLAALKAGFLHPELQRVHRATAAPPARGGSSRSRSSSSRAS